MKNISFALASLLLVITQLSFVSAETLEVTATGVGIGTSSPSEELEVDGDALVNGQLGIEAANGNKITLEDRYISFDGSQNGYIRQLASGKDLRHALVHQDATGRVDCRMACLRSPG